MLTRLLSLISIVAAIVVIVIYARLGDAAQQLSSARRVLSVHGEGGQVLGSVSVVTVADGLEHPWSIAFLPDDNILVTERPGRLRVIRNGVLDPVPVEGMPEVIRPLPPLPAGANTQRAERAAGLMDLALHPNFAENNLVYFTYSKPTTLPPGVQPNRARLELPDRLTVDKMTGEVVKPFEATGRASLATLAVGRWNGSTVTDIRDVFVTNDLLDDSMSMTNAASIVFGPDGMLYMGIGAPNAPAREGRFSTALGGRAQQPDSHGGKVLRLRADGTVPPDNPFVRRRGYSPEIYTMGHRNPLGLAVHPETGAIWMSENGPQDGDEINILKPGANYGWPIVGMGRDYRGDYIGGKGALGSAGRDDAHTMFMPGMEQPWIFWAPTPAPGGLTFYTGDRFPEWRGSLFVAQMQGARLERFVFNKQGWPVERQYLLQDLKQRIRNVRQGPDGLLYVLTDATDGAVLRLERSTVTSSSSQ